MTDDDSRPALEIGRALRELIRERASCRPGGHLLEGTLGRLQLELDLDVGDNDEARFAASLTDAIDRLLDEEIARAASFRPGRIYCHRCRRTDCAHAEPPDGRHVFVGYSATGQPRWEDFAQACLELRHPRVDALYDDPPALVTLVHDGRTLRSALLPAIDDRLYRIEGQLLAGFFPVATRADEGRGVLALTLQVVSSRTAQGGTRVALNLVGRGPSGEALESVWDRQQEDE